MCLIYGDEAAFGELSPDEQGQVFAAYNAFDKELAAAGNVKIAGAPLKSVTHATTVRVRDGKIRSTDGPFAETKEQLGGYYIFECRDLNEALGWAAKIPGAKDGSIEVRPVLELS